MEQDRICTNLTFQDRIKSSELSYSQIAEELRVPKTTVRSWARGYKLPPHHLEWHYIQELNSAERKIDDKVSK